MSQGKGTEPSWDRSCSARTWDRSTLCLAPNSAQLAPRRHLSPFPLCVYPALLPPAYHACDIALHAEDHWRSCLAVVRRRAAAPRLGAGHRSSQLRSCLATLARRPLLHSLAPPVPQRGRGASGSGASSHPTPLSPLVPSLGPSESAAPVRPPGPAPLLAHAAAAVLRQHALLGVQDQAGRHPDRVHRAQEEQEVPRRNGVAHSWHHLRPGPRAGRRAAGPAGRRP